MDPLRHAKRGKIDWWITAGLTPLFMRNEGEFGKGGLWGYVLVPRECTNVMMSTTVHHLFTHFSHTFSSFTGLCTLWIACTRRLADLMVTSVTLWYNRDAKRQTKHTDTHTQRDTEMRSTNKHFLSVYSQKLLFVPLWLSFLLPLCGTVHPCLLSITQRPQCPREHSFLRSKYTTNPRIPWGLAVIKHVYSLAARPSPLSLTFSFSFFTHSPITLYFLFSLVPSPSFCLWFVRWSNCLLLPPPVAFNYSHLHIHALAVWPASRWDWSTTQQHVLLHVSQRQRPYAVGIHWHVHAYVLNLACMEYTGISKPT